MPKNYSGRITAIVVVLLLALFAIFPPRSLLDRGLGFSQKLNLKPGIDMVGGTSLLYEIKASGAMAGNTQLSEQVMEALKRRVDPDGVRNLIWRPQGPTRLEIQMPMSSQSEDARAAREAYTRARDQLAATNVRAPEVINAVEKLTGDARANRLNELAQGSTARAELFGALRSVYDQMQQAKQEHNAKLQAEKESQYDQLKKKIDTTNLSVAELESVLSVEDAKTREAKVADLRARAAGFDARLKAIDQFDNAYASYGKLRNSIDDAGELKRLLKGSGVLEFHIMVTSLGDPEAQRMAQRLQEKGPAPQAGDRMRWFLVDRPQDAQGVASQEYPKGSGKWYALGWTTPEKQLVNGPGVARWALEGAYPTSDQWGLRAVGFRFDAQGAKYFGELTGRNLKQMLGVMLDEKLISNAVIQSQITHDGQISRDTGYGDEDFKYLISTLSAGSLPAQLADEPISERTVEPQLGAANLRAGLISCVIGLGIVAVFLVVYYYIAGIVAFIAVLMNVVLILGAMAAFNATFTLAGVAGIVLTIGAAVDANVLIFERLREEQHRGLSLRMALRNAYDRAFSAILDSNVTTIITAVVLYWLGSEEVKGFGLTLLIGLLGSLFTALFVTKTIFGIMVDKFGVQHLGSLPLTFPKWDKLLKPNVDWMGKAWIFITISVVFIVAGMAAFVAKARQQELMDIEFAGGTSVQFELKQPMAKQAIEDALKPYESGKGPLSGATVLKLGSGMGDTSSEFEVVTPNADSANVKDAIMRSLGNDLKLELQAKFDHVDEPVEQAMNSGAVVPIESAGQAVEGYVPVSLPNHVGGVAIVLNRMDPPLAPREIKDRIERQRLQPTPGQQTQPYRDIDVEAIQSNGQGQALAAVVLVSDPNLAYSANQTNDQWRDQLATPMWKLVNDAVNKPPQLQKVSNFGAQVAGDTQRDAMLALVISLAVIMAYIWMRFGNMQYGTATVVAMLHDTLFVVGAIGLSHYLAGTAVGQALLIEPFRVNLTIVAAILTIMSYSMIDTIVVFDRIRENRGKYGHMDRQVINDSINQTLSRTLLTGSTNIFTVLAMYLLGGPGIHGFTFVMLVGILVGTYSSIAIASPMLLLGGARKSVEEESSARKPSVGRAMPRLET